MPPTSVCCTDETCVTSLAEFLAHRKHPVNGNCDDDDDDSSGDDNHGGADDDSITGKIKLESHKASK